jgi:hypothetical protein
MVSVESSTGNVIADPTYQSVSIESNLLLTFSKAFVKASDSAALNISIYEQGGALHQTFNLNSNFNSDFTSEIVRVTSTTIELNPTKDFKVGQNYYCHISADIIKSADCGVLYPGVLTTTTIAWKTVNFTATTISPTSGATNQVVNSSNIALSFPQAVVPGTGNVKIFTGNTLVATLPATDSRITYS